LVRFLSGYTHAITGLDVLDDAVFSAVPELRLVSKYGVGLDMIDLDAARRHGVAVRWTPGVNRQAVAELTICFMIALCRSIVPLASQLAAGGWSHPGGRQLSSCTVGIVGCGCVGQQVARLSRAFGATVLAHVDCIASCVATRHRLPGSILRALNRRAARTLARPGSALHDACTVTKIAFSSGRFRPRVLSDPHGRRRP